MLYRGLAIVSVGLGVGNVFLTGCKGDGSNNSKHAAGGGGNQFAGGGQQQGGSTQKTFILQPDFQKIISILKCKTIVVAKFIFSSKF